MPTYEELGFGRGAALTGDRARTAFGHVMGLVALTLGFAALGAYIGRDWTGGTGIGFLIPLFALVFGLNIAANKGHEQLATAMLFGLGLFLGLVVGPIINYYAQTNPGVVYEAAGSTALFVAAAGSFGYSTRRDLSSMYRTMFIAFAIVLVFGIITLFVVIPGSNIIYCVLMLGIFGFFTAFDFQRLTRTRNYTSPVPIAASIFLDIFNVFLLLLSLFGGGSTRR